MEDLLTLLMKDAQASKFTPIRQACQHALGTLRNKEEVARLPAYLLREKCLEPLSLALDSKTKRLMTHAVSGIEKILTDERLQSSMEMEHEDRWLPIQILKAVYVTPNLPEDIQVDVMKLLLKMTFSTAWCMNSNIIAQVTQVYIDMYGCGSNSVRGVVQAALTQMLSGFTEKLSAATKLQQGIQENNLPANLQRCELKMHWLTLQQCQIPWNEPVHAGNDVMSDFNAKGDLQMVNLMEDVVILLSFLTDKVTAAHKAGQNKQALPLLLEGILAVLTNSPGQLKDSSSFQQLVWQKLCPTLIAVLGLPRADVKQKPVSENPRNIDCPSLSPNTAKVIYSISVSVAKMVGPVRSLRPVLESLFHRFLLCPSPLHRHDAVKAVKQLLSSADILCELTLTVDDEDGRPVRSGSNTNDLALIKMIVSSIQECCHTNDLGICYTSVTCIDELLATIGQLDKGIGISEDKASDILAKYSRKTDKKRSSSDRSCSVTSTSDVEETATTPQQSASVSEPGTSHGDMHSWTGSLQDENHKLLDQQSSQRFLDELCALVPDMLNLYSVPEVDEMLQKFASNFSQRISDLDHNGKQSNTYSTVLNADSIYASSLAALSFNLNLFLSGFYDTRDKALLTLTQHQFIDDILDTDQLLYLSPDWLGQVYTGIVARDLLSESGWSHDEDLALITTLKGIDGKGEDLPRSQLSRDSGGIDTDQSGPSHSRAHAAGKLLAREIMSTCWDGILDVLSLLLKAEYVGMANSFAVILRTEGAKEEEARKKEILCKCLDGLQKAAKLCCSLDLQERCGAVFAQMASICVMEDSHNVTPHTAERSAQKSALPAPGKPKLVRLHATHVLSMDAMMTTGLEIGSHSPDCWKYIFRCCAFISELEHKYFSSGNNQSNLPRIQQEQAAVNMPDTADGDDDMYSVPIAPVVPVAPRINVSNLIKQSQTESGWDRSAGGGVLNPAQASRALCGLSQEVDKLFEDAASQLRLKALTAFLADLCEASKHQLQKISRRLGEVEEELMGDYRPLPTNSLHLYRLENMIMSVVHSDRPLLHLIKAWSIVSSYLVESAGHKDRSISKMAVTCVHDFVIAVLSKHPEMKHFHTNDMLCKTFENILCLELCDGDVQDQIVCSICELVEASAADIKSGWRPLFGALRAVRIEYTTIEEVNEARQRHVEAVLDVFDVYLNTDNILVFANATVDCILCLLKYVKGPGEFEDSDMEDSDSVGDYMLSSPESENLCLPALEYLKQCAIILQSMWNMPACPVFNGAKRIQDSTFHRCVDPNIPNMDLRKFSKYFHVESTPAKPDVEPHGEGLTVLREPLAVTKETSLHVTDEKGDSVSVHSNDSGIILSTTKDSPEIKPGDSALDREGQRSRDGQTSDKKVTDPCSGDKKFDGNRGAGQAQTKRGGVVSLTKPCLELSINLNDLDTETGILHVWFLLLEGLSGAISACPRSYQPHTMDTLFELLRSAAHVPGPKFGVFCMNHLLLPMLQSWLRCGSRKFGYWETGATNFKQCCGHTTDLLVDLIEEFKGDADMSSMLESVLTNLLLVLTECVAQPFEVISRLGCSCIRHIVLSAGDHFNSRLWQLMIDGLQNALDVTMYCTRQLMLLFHTNSESFYGDVGQVKVATRKDCTPSEAFRLWHLAQQVFLLDSQVCVDAATNLEAEDKSYVFLLYPPGYENSLNPDHIIARVPFRSIVIGLLSHQLLLQTLGCVLLEGNSTPDSVMPGMLSRLSTSNVQQLLDCLRSSYKLACEFDLRPGLKFLIQKVARTQVAVNLYKQAGASMVFYIHTLIKICSAIPELSQSSVRDLLAKDTRKKSVGPEVMPKELHRPDNGDQTQRGENADHKTHCETKAEPKSEKFSKSDVRKEKVGKSCDSGAIETTSVSKDLTEEVDGGDESVSAVSKVKFHEKQSPENEEETMIANRTKERKDVIGAPYEGEKSSNAEGNISNDNIDGVEVESSNHAAGCIVDKIEELKPALIDNPLLFVSLLRSVCDELCQTYIDILYDKAGTSCVDNMADQQLFFLIAQPDEFPEVHHKLDVKNLTAQLEQTQARLQGLSVTQAVSIQGEELGLVTSPAKLAAETASVLPPLSPHDSPQKSKKEMRTDHESRIYNLATDKLIKNLMLEYKKRKHQHAMPTFAKVSKEKKKKAAPPRKAPSDPVTQVIEQQQQSSIMKDSEAHLQSWTELLCTILGLFQQLDDNHFTTLLPTVFKCVNQLVCHAHDMRLREELAQWLHRVGDLFSLSV